LAIVPVKGSSAPVNINAGPWAFTEAPATLPDWVVPANGFKGTLALSTAAEDAGGGLRAVLLMRSVVPVPRTDLIVVTDLPLNDKVVDYIDERSGIRAGSVEIVKERTGTARPLLGSVRLRQLFERPTAPGSTTMFRNSVA